MSWIKVHKLAVAAFLGLFLFWALCLDAFALNPKNETQFRESLAKFVQVMGLLEQKMSLAFQPGVPEGQTGIEEIAWRVRDLQEKAQKLNRLCQDYWKNETEILGLLDRWHEDAKLVDETMIYTPVSSEISDLWKSGKEYAMAVRDFVEEMPSEEEVQKLWEEFGFEITKVGRYERKQVLREKIKEFVGGSQLDQWPFAAEKTNLDPRDVGEHFVVRFKLEPQQGGNLSFPLKLRFEYKFAGHAHDGADETVYTDLKGGTHDFVFKNMGEKYAERGKVIHWRASLLLNEKVVAQKKSAMWTVVTEWGAAPSGKPG